jgi:transketolase C-terminal domain/subunit
MRPTALAAAETLAAAGIAVERWSTPVVNPLDEALSQGSRWPAFLTVEETASLGGLRSAVMEC